MQSSTALVFVFMILFWLCKLPQFFKSNKIFGLYIKFTFEIQIQGDLKKTEDLKGDLKETETETLGGGDEFQLTHSLTFY